MRKIIGLPTREYLLLIWICVLGVVLSPGMTLAQDSAIQSGPEFGSNVAPIAMEGGNGNSQSPFSFAWFLKLVDKHYPKLLSADAERRIAGARRLEKSGAFDPVLTHISEYQRVQDIFEPGKAKNAIHNESRVDLLTRSGFRVFAQARLNPNDTKTPFVPTGKAGEYSAGFALPLLRGLIVNEKTAAEQVARLGEPLASNVYGATRLEIMLKAAIIYWDWVGAKARMDVARNLLTIAEKRVEQVKGRVENGDSPALDIAEAEQEIQRRKALLVKTEREFQKATFSLSVFLWKDDGTPASVPTTQDAPPLGAKPRLLSEADWLEGRRIAFERRPELKRIAIEREQAKVDLRLAKNLILPAFDAYFAQGADTGPQGIGPVLRGGVAVSMPLRQRTARGQAQAAQLKIEKLTLDEKAEKLRIQREVDDTVSAINTAFDRYTASRLEVENAKAVEAGERLRFGAGDSTLFLVNQRERSTAEAEVRLLEAHTDFLQALAAFNAVTCRL